MENKKITFEVTIEDANIILNALSTQPFAQVAKLINELQGQAANQLQPEAEVK
jgi:LPS sulfotransferase NodH